MVPIANGIAFANKYKKNDNIVVAYLGDGGINEGYVLEALNLAVVLKLPILFVCENNLYAMSTHVDRSHSAPIHQKVKAFGIKCEVIHNNDFIKLDSVAKRFVEEVRLYKEPRFIEVRTYRHYGHSKNDLNLYRDKDEEKFWFEKDVMKIVEEELIKSKELTQDDVNKLKEEYQAYIDSIAEDVINLPEHTEKDVLKHVYAE